MPLFYTSPFHELDSLFRFVDGAVSGKPQRCGGPAFGQLQRQQEQHLRRFNPTFDVRETESSYELHGELPGVEQKDVTVEFVDPTTLVIKGHTERHYTAGTPPKSVEDGNAIPNAVEDAETASVASQPASTTAPASGYKSPSVEDEDGQAATGTTPAVESENKGKEVADKQPEQAEPEQPKDRFWISERSTGSFQRSFSFPATIDNENVRASLKNGILKIVVPKRVDLGSRRIEIQ